MTLANLLNILHPFSVYISNANFFIKFRVGQLTFSFIILFNFFYFFIIFVWTYLSCFYLANIFNFCFAISKLVFALINNSRIYSFFFEVISFLRSLTIFLYMKVRINISKYTIRNIYLQYDEQA